MPINSKAQIYWACRRGMREVEMWIMPFFKYDFDTLSHKEQEAFTRLLEYDDPDLFNWLMKHERPIDNNLQQIISTIQQRNTARRGLFENIKSYDF